MQKQTKSGSSGSKQKNTENQFPDAATFASAFGQAVWLMTVSKSHRDLKISDIENLVTPAILLKQFKIYMKDKQPVAFLAWASVSDEIKDRFETERPKLEPNEWRSGSNIIIAECVSPFAPKEQIIEQFIEKTNAMVTRLKL